MTGAVNAITILIQKKRWHWCCLFFFCFCNCHHPASRPIHAATKADDVSNSIILKNAIIKINTAQKNIQTGDIITRVGNDFTSECLRQINLRDKTWSHCGIASVEHDSVFVYHALGGEFNPDQQLRRDYLDVFADPANNRGIGIYRQQLSKKELQQLTMVIKKLYAVHIMFDMKFDLQTDERMYCAEFVYKAFLWSTGHRVCFSTSTIKQKVFVGVDDIILFPGCIQLQKVLYKE